MTDVPCLIRDGFISPKEVEECVAEIQRRRGKWVTYDNDCEKKTTCNDPTAMGDKLQGLLARMQGEFVKEVEQAFDIKPLMSDPLLHGGGIHISGRGGRLSIHLDYAKHPRLPLLERRANAIIYLVPRWCPEWGGATVLTKPDGTTAIQECLPVPGRLFLFETNDLSYHGVTPITCPEGIERITLATYYLSHIRPGVSRERALFCPNRERGSW